MENRNGMGVASLILGIASLLGLCMCAGPITGAIAIGLGIVALRRNPEDRAFPITGIITGIVGILLSLIIVIILAVSVNLDTDLNDIDKIYETIEDMYDM